MVRFHDFLFVYHPISSFIFSCFYEHWHMLHNSLCPFVHNDFVYKYVVINLFIYLCIYLQAYHGTSRSVVWKLTEPDFAWLKNHKIKVPHGRLSFNIQDLLKEVFIQLIPSTKFIRKKSQNLYVISAVVGGGRAATIDDLFIYPPSIIYIYFACWQYLIPGIYNSKYFPIVPKEPSNSV